MRTQPGPEVIGQKINFGEDALVAVRENIGKKALHQSGFNIYPTGIASFDTSNDGFVLAIPSIGRELISLDSAINGLAVSVHGVRRRQESSFLVIAFSSDSAELPADELADASQRFVDRYNTALQYNRDARRLPGLT